MELSPRYNPATVEDKWYQIWRERGYFRPRPRPDQPTFSIVMPPPNVTGVLHLGHALNTTWQDILIRYHRMRQEPTLWVPGTDHAGIHTQIKVEELLRSRGVDRRQMGRDAFVAEVWRWKEQYGGRILEQIAKLGASVDWDRLRFTLDEGLSRAVTEVFVRLYEEGLIYRGHYITNWCVTCGTALSDIEVEHRDETGTLTSIRYPLASGDGAVVVATTRPETLLGDTAVAVHPDDPRYRHLIGQTVIVPLVGRAVPIIADTYVDPDFGSGAVKVTPAHDPNDFQMGQRHQLPTIAVIGEDGRMTAEAGAYQGLTREAARIRVLEDLKAEGLVVSEEPIDHAVGHCEKCDSVIEPLVSLQWFVKVQPLAEPAIEAVKTGAVRFVPERFEKIYMNWMENIHDWCISRQIWWGHRIPAYYCQVCGNMVVSRTAVTECPVCQGPMEQDPDVLDTWFSSALWPFSTLGWPDATDDLREFYPTSVLSTGYDIIFFWVSRMLMQGIHFTGQKPFTTVLLHGLVRDAQGRKMSKSLGNGVDPLEVINKYGSDALRIALVLGSAPGNDYRWSWERFEAGSHFANKVYNAMRFVLMNLDGAHIPENTSVSNYPVDQWIWSRLNETIRVITDALDHFEFGLAAKAIYDFFWDDYCDWYIEMTKVRLKGADRERALANLVMVGRHALQLLHPFMPFVTEELYQALGPQEESIMISEWPAPQRERESQEAARDVETVQAFIRTVRNLRAEIRVAPQAQVPVVAIADDRDVLQVWTRLAPEIEWLLKAKPLTLMQKGGDAPTRTIAGMTNGGVVHIPLEGLVDVEKERERLAALKAETLAERQRIRARLADAKFLQRAPEAVVLETQKRLEELDARIRRLSEREATLT
jgi:valyl-tRNA synthetase